MKTEAQRLIKISRNKIRAQPGGVSLHKKLMVATVVQKLQKVLSFLEEEACHMPQSQHGRAYSGYMTTIAKNPREQQQGYVVVTLKKAGIGLSQHTTPQSEVAPTGYNYLQEFLQPTESYGCADTTPSLPSYEDEKENQTPCYYADTASLQSEVPTYLDMDKQHTLGGSVLQDRANATSTCSWTRSHKRQRSTVEYETEDTVSSILLKRAKTSDACCESDNPVFLGNAAISDSVVTCSDEEKGSMVMEVDQVTSLVSIFGLGHIAGNEAAAATDMSAGGRNWKADSFGIHPRLVLSLNCGKC